jgi:hypothetical protein
MKRRVFHFAVVNPELKLRSSAEGLISVAFATQGNQTAIGIAAVPEGKSSR